MTDPAMDFPALPSPEERPSSAMDAVGSEFQDLEKQARAFIQEQPIVAVVAAVGLGYVLARLLSPGNR